MSEGTLYVDGNPSLQGWNGNLDSTTLVDSPSPLKSHRIVPKGLSCIVSPQVIIITDVDVAEDPLIII